MSNYLGWTLCYLLNVVSLPVVGLFSAVAAVLVGGAPEHDGLLGRRGTLLGRGRAHRAGVGTPLPTAPQALVLGGPANRGAICRLCPQNLGISPPPPLST